MNEKTELQTLPPRWPALALVLMGAVTRLIPHPPNFTAVGGMALFAGARLSGWQAYLLPLVLMAITDPILASIGGYPAFGRGRVTVYAAFLINVWIGRRLRSSESPIGIGAAAFLCSLQFFLITNFVWFPNHLYPQTWSGIVASYTAALPFFGRTLAGDLFFSALFFGTHAWLSRRLVQRQRVSFATARP
jgi:hypothetical protein